MNNEQLDWYDEEELAKVWKIVGEEQIALAEMGMEDYNNILKEIDNENNITSVC